MMSTSLTGTVGALKSAPRRVHDHRLPSSPPPLLCAAAMISAIANLQKLSARTARPGATNVR